MLPDLLIDRSLGGIAVPRYFIGAWPSSVRTIDDVFGRGKVADEVWMKRADDQNWVAICKDDRIRRRIGERQLMSQGTLRVFCLANGNLTRGVQVERFERALPAIQAQAREVGPWMFGVYAHGIERLKLYA